MSYVPAALRRTGYHYQSSICRSGGFGALTVREQHELRSGVEHVVNLGTRAMCELLPEAAQDRCDLTSLLARLREWRERLTPEMMQVTGGNRFAPAPLHEVAR